MNKSTKVLIVMVIITIALFILNEIVNNKAQITNKDAYITINSEQMPSIYSKLGEKTITKISDGYDETGKYIEIVYKNITIAEILEYINELGEIDYLLTDSSETNAVMAKESTSAGKILTISIIYSENSTAIKYSRGNGTLTRS